MEREEKDEIRDISTGDIKQWYFLLENWGNQGLHCIKNNISLWDCVHENLSLVWRVVLIKNLENLFLLFIMNLQSESCIMVPIVHIKQTGF